MADRCSFCPQNDDGRYCNSPVPPAGPTPCPVLFIGAGPFGGENRSGLPYTGLAGDELTSTYLPLAGLNREDVAIGYTSQCWDGSDRTPGEKRVVGCARHHLPRLLEEVRPDVVVLMGGVTQRIADTRIRLDVDHGIPVRTSLLGGMWEGWVVPMFEPGLGIRETGKMTDLMDDFRRLGQWMRREWTKPEPTILKTDYREITTVAQLDLYLMGQPWHRNIALDGEDHGQGSWIERVWSLQISHTPGTGRLIRTANTAVIRALAEFARERAQDTTWIMHNAPGDMDRCHALGIELKEWRDTMEEAFHLCSLPQGLKALVYRLFGHRMQSWEDVVWPASVYAWLEWCERALALAQTRPDITIHELKRERCVDCGHQHAKGLPFCKRCMEKDGVLCDSQRRTTQKIEESPSALESILRHVGRYTMQTREDDEPYNPWKELPAKRREGLRGRVAGTEVWEWVEGEIGKPPVLGIANADLATAIDYGCADSDWTLRLARRLEEERQGRKWVVDREDWDI